MRLRPLALSALAALTLLALPAVAKDPALGTSTFVVYEAFLSPAQEPGEESETPKALKKSLGATAPSTPRAERKSRGWGEVKFTADRSSAIVNVQIEGVKPEDIVMFHIHCGRPGILGPILVDLGADPAHAGHGEHAADWTKLIQNGSFTKTITNADINFITELPGMAPGLPEACPIGSGLPGQVKTIGGMEHIAREGLLYFNLHTKAHTYYGEMRGQIYPAVQ